MSFEYKLYDYFDTEKEKPIHRSFEKPLAPNQEFDIEGVTYKVTGIEADSDESPTVVVRMIRYKISNTTTQFIHYCPAEKRRIKMQGHMTIQCPHCKVIFWKESMEMPEQVQVPKVYPEKRQTP